MYPRAVICLAGESLQNMIELIHRAEQMTKVPIFEVRGDSLPQQELNLTTLKRLRAETQRKLILTLRSRKEGGKRDIGEHFRKELFIDAISLGYEFVDIEASSDKKLIQELLINKGDSSIILSYHNFHETDENDIKMKIEGMRKVHPDIIKIVTMAITKEDNKLIEKILLDNRNSVPPLTCFCMGKVGKQSRINGYTLGNALTYLALDEEVFSAIGQLTYSEFLMI
ncbi:MAG: type I 3-dehydroquinate dehydratase [Candidatus Hodarchaeales archaeon]|jgi:3-dehydroquinate dehydratase-1